jgi:hypothetical protein
MRMMRIKSKAFREGFCDGFTAYLDTFAENKFPRSSGVEVSVARAWSDVGEALREAEKTGWGEVGKRSTKAARKEHATSR